VDTDTTQCKTEFDAINETGNGIFRENRKIDELFTVNGYTIKPAKSVEGSVGKFKAHLVVKGFSQRAGVDCDKSFAPVEHSQSLRTIIAIAAEYDLHLGLLDILGAFLNGVLTDEIYTKQPEGLLSPEKKT
jgi:hypothetical protein